MKIYYIVFIFILNGCFDNNYVLIWDLFHKDTNQDNEISITYDFNDSLTEENINQECSKSSVLTWVYNYNDGIFDKWAKMIYPLDDGYIIVGYMYEYDHSNKNNLDSWITKLNEQGNIIWQKRYGIDADFGYYTSDLIILDDAFVLTGSRQESENKMEFWAKKIDINGNLIWEKLYNYLYDSISAIPNYYEPRIYKALDKGYMIVGFSYNPYVVDLFGEDIPRTPFILKTNHLFETEWQNWYLLFFGLLKVSYEGGYILAGESNGCILFEPSGDVDNPSPVKYNVMPVYKIDNGGKIIWAKQFWTTQSEGYCNGGAKSIFEKSNGEYLILGTIADAYYSNNKILIMAIDEDGNLINNLILDNLNEYRSFNLESIDKTTDGSYIISATVRDDSKYDSILFKLDENLDILWEKLYKGIYLYWIKSTHDGGIVALAYENCEESNACKRFVLKLDSDGNPPCSCPADKWGKKLDLLIKKTITIYTKEWGFPIYTWSINGSSKDIQTQYKDCEGSMEPFCL